MAQGSAAEVLGDPAVLPTGARKAGTALIAAVTAHHAPLGAVFGTR
ncbi:MAG: hypothetical protein K9G33_10495 [Sneathiella sp.]|nr:hypothetical protein [Sneathiella sp.]